jgi:integrase
MPKLGLADKKLPEPFKHRLGKIIEIKGKKAARSPRVVGEHTHICRHNSLFRSFGETFELGYKLPEPESLREVHVKALVDSWLSRGLTPATIQNRLTHLRQFCDWIGKPGMVRHTEYYVDEANVHRVRRTVVAKESLGWDAKGVDPLVVIEKMEKEDKWTALYLRLMHAFGLRLKEAIHLRPALDIAVSGRTLSVRDGTKGGRHRMVPIENDYQRETLVIANKMAQAKNKRIIPLTCSLDQAYQRSRYRMTKMGITREVLGVTAHGLRHQYAQKSYETITGKPSPIAGGDPKQIDRDTHQLACHEVMERLGHSRVDVGGNYYGSYGHALRGTASPADYWETLLRSQKEKPQYGKAVAAPIGNVAYAFVLTAPGKKDEGSEATSMDNSKEQE